MLDDSKHIFQLLNVFSRFIEDSSMLLTPRQTWSEFHLGEEFRSLSFGLASAVEARKKASKLLSFSGSGSASDTGLWITLVERSPPSDTPGCSLFPDIPMSLHRFRGRELLLDEPSKNFLLRVLFPFLPWEQSLQSVPLPQEDAINSSFENAEHHIESGPTRMLLKQQKLDSNSVFLVISSVVDESYLVRLPLSCFEVAVPWCQDYRLCASEVSLPFHASPSRNSQGNTLFHFDQYESSSKVDVLLDNLTCNSLRSRGISSVQIGSVMTLLPSIRLYGVDAVTAVLKTVPSANGWLDSLLKATRLLHDLQLLPKFVNSLLLPQNSLTQSVCRSRIHLMHTTKEEQPEKESTAFDYPVSARVKNSKTGAIQVIKNHQRVQYLWETHKHKASFPPKFFCQACGGAHQTWDQTVCPLALWVGVEYKTFEKSLSALDRAANDNNHGLVEDDEIAVCLGLAPSEDLVTLPKIDSETRSRILRRAPANGVTSTPANSDALVTLNVETVSRKKHRKEDNFDDSKVLAALRSRRRNQPPWEIFLDVLDAASGKGDTAAAFALLDHAIGEVKNKLRRMEIFDQQSFRIALERAIQLSAHPHFCSQILAAVDDELASRGEHCIPPQGFITSAVGAGNLPPHLDSLRQ